MRIEKMILGTIDTNTYIVIGEDQRSAVLIDPSSEAKRLIARIEALEITIKAILITHGHFDHIGAVMEINKYLKVPVIAHELEAEMMADSTKNLSLLFNGQAITAQATQFVVDGEILTFGQGLTFQALQVSGHSPKSICYYSQEAEALFSGDTLFKNGVGRVDLYEGSPLDLCKYIRSHLFALPETTTVYPGHGLETTILHEKKFGLCNSEWKGRANDNKRASTVSKTSGNRTSNINSGFEK